MAEETPKSPPTALYELLPGKKHVHDGKALTPGDKVPLTEIQAEAFKDKFKRA